ncbi:hypothetical protein I5M32_11645 [Pedobacter sp. SD-b]|uniref:Alpha-L-arabinofuranosidase n=1 Tax=Pedobacter segetis TaxID=2793069 RepID=A0ABS1BL86_9SPHI|nr:hypothetical protein [Pedobacter segetis]MBK0383611.1 hypothetical protein [Pedobacter segetis]
MKKFLILFYLTLAFVACKKDKKQPAPTPTPDPLKTTDLSVWANDKVTINPEIFGVNNDWKTITNTNFPAFANNLKLMNYKLMRYPGGWESEYYDWNNNTTPGWDKTPDSPGASVASLKANVDSYSIVVPTVKAMNEQVFSTNWWSAVSSLKNTAVNAINKADPSKVKIVEIGNEWFLQWGGGVSRADKLTKYAKIAMNIAEYIDQQFPNRTFKLLVNGDYTVPSEFADMKNAFTKSYNSIDGVALHTYTGYTTDDHNIKDLAARIKDCANNFNPAKNYVYCSEWIPSRAYNDGKLYMEAANIIPDIIHIYARSGVNAAAYWPPANNSIPGLGLFNPGQTATYPCAQIMGELSKSYTGEALKTTSSDIHISATLNDNNTITLFVTGSNQPASDVSIKINDFAVGSIQSVTKLRPSDYYKTDDSKPYLTENASATLDQANNKINFTINKAGKYEIFKIVLKK